MVSDAATPPDDDSVARPSDVPPVPTATARPFARVPSAGSEVEARLRRCLDDGAIRVHYQPVVTLPSARALGVEALARWTDDVLGVVPPDVFIPLAESTGLIERLGTHVLQESCRTAAGWPTHGDSTPRVAVNVSPIQLADPSFVRQVSSALDASHLDPQRLVLEITETAAVADLDEGAHRLDALRGLGVQIALDDFGIGHSPLSLLQRLPLDILKIDRSFVTHVHDNARDAIVVRLLIDTAHTLGLTVCGEGVETREQGRQLLALGCDTAQGWYFGRPAPATAELAHQLDEVSGRIVLALDPTEPAPIQIGSDELVTITDPDSTVVYASPGSLAVLGITPSDLMGRSVAEHLHPDESDDLVAGLATERADRARVRVHRARHRDGSYRWLSTRSQMLRDEVGRPQQVIATSRDVTPQVETEHQLATLSATLRWAFDQSPIGMALSRFDGVIVRSNSAFAAMLGYTADDMVGLKVSDITCAEDQARDTDNLRHLLDEPHRSQRVRKGYLHRDGHCVDAEVWASTLDDELGDPAYVVAHIMPTGELP